MEEEKELIRHPFIISNPADTKLYKTESGFDLQFADELVSKSVKSTASDSSKHYIVIEVENSEVKVLYETNELHQFTKPADFYIPTDEASKDFYEDFYEHLITDNSAELTKFTNKLDSELSKQGFPSFPLPVISTAEHFTNFSTEPYKNTEPDRVYCTRSSFGQQVPTSPPSIIAEVQLKRVGSAGFAVQNRFFAELFWEKSIWRFLDVLTEYERRLTKREKELFKKWHLKRCLSIHAYFYTSGPWRSLWVRYGYDPAANSESYLWQWINIEGRKPTTRVFELQSIVEEVSRKPEWYLRKECHPVDGFISDALKTLIEMEFANVKDVERS